MNRIKLIWDFRGIDAKKTAEHHVIHLDEFSKKENLKQTESGLVEETDVHAIAYLTVLEKDMILVRDALRPHRGEHA